MTAERNLFGVRVVSDVFAPEDEAFIVGDFEKPLEWETLTLAARIRWMVDNGQIVAVKNINHLYSEVRKIVDDRGMG